MFKPVFALILACVLAYANSFRVPVLLDDVAGIAENKTIEHLSTSLAPPPDSSLTGRPFVNVTLALNYAISGRDLRSYHAGNLLLHIVSTLTLFALVGRALRPTSPGPASGVKPDLRVSIAFLAALLWSLHPLHTVSVTYLMQRTELLVSACYLLTLCCFVRGCERERVARPSSHSLTLAATGYPASILCCALGMASKEVMVTAPVVVWLYDRTFLSGSFRAALRARGLFYPLLASTWAILFAFVLGTDNRGASAGFGTAVPWYAYLATQLYAIPHYLRLALWPSPLVFDYGVTLVRDPLAIALGALVVVTLLAFTVLGLLRRSALGFSGAWFFLLLAPTSSIVPIATQVMGEQRIYLALAAPVVVFVVLLHRLLGRGAWLVGVPVAVALGIATFERNALFASPTALWRDVIAHQPDNGRAHYNLGLNLLAAHEWPEAEKEFRRALELEPDNIRARHKLGTALLESGRPAEALPYLEAGLKLRRTSASAHADLAMALIGVGRPAEAPRLLQESIRLEPDNAVTHYNLGHVLADLGKYPEALAEFETAVRLDPKDLAAANNAARLREYLKR